MVLPLDAYCSCCLESKGSESLIYCLDIYLFLNPLKIIDAIAIMLAEFVFEINAKQTTLSRLIQGLKSDR